VNLASIAKARRRTVGTKETLKALERGEPKAVFVAEDAERRVVEPVLRLCAEKNVPVVRVESMEALGRACGIKVGCASASIIEE